MDIEWKNRNKNFILIIIYSNVVQILLSPIMSVKSKIINIHHKKNVTLFSNSPINCAHCMSRCTLPAFNSRMNSANKLDFIVTKKFL